MPSRARGIAIGVTVAILLMAWAMTVDGFFVAPSVLRWTNQSRGEALAHAYGAELENVSMRAADGVTLRGWLFTPQNYRDRAVLLVHPGLGNRQDMLATAEWLLARGYSCLLIDQRGCGSSGGEVSWGVHEPADVAEWARWLRDRTHAIAIFGNGVSRGSTTLLQSLAFRPPFTGLVLEASGAGNISQPYQLLGDKMGVPERRARWMLWPLIEPSLWWIRLHYGFDMKRVANGITAIRGSEVPVLLMQGAEDRNATVASGERLREANPQRIEMVVIPGADHQWFSPARPEGMRRMLAWFEVHS